MPIIDMPIPMLLAHINKGAATPLPEADLPEKVMRLGCEVEELAETQQFLCNVCGKIYDRTEAQGMPIVCSACGTDFRAAPEQLGDLGHGQGHAPRHARRPVGHL